MILFVYCLIRMIELATTTPKGYKKETLADETSKRDEKEESVDTTPRGYEEAKKQKSKSRLQTNHYPNFQYY